VRTAYALRPDGILAAAGRAHQPALELLSKANGIDHGHAHEALSDVRATIALARLIRQKQPKLYDWLFQLRSKHKVMEQIRCCSRWCIYPGVFLRRVITWVWCCHWPGTRVIAMR
jgi:exodeoxyribonuclease-1